METIVSGAGDDTVTVEGDLFSEEWYVDCEEKIILVFSNGLMLAIEYTQMAEWKMNVYVNPEDADIEIHSSGEWERAEEYYIKDYSDVAVINDEIEWVANADEWATS